MKRLILIAVTLTAGCVQMPSPQSQSTRQSSEQTAKQSAEQSSDQDASSAHTSAAKQGTSSMPVIIICNNLNSSSARCSSPQGSSELQDTVNKRLRDGR
jgi:hypothetical protein